MTSADAYPVQKIFQMFYYEFLESHTSLSAEKRKTATDIMYCKTGGLGYNFSYCEDCGHPVIHAVSCNNRSCPCCQAPMEKKWELERNTELIQGISYFHVVFTIPHELNDLVKANPKELLGLQFKCVQDTLLTLCADKNYLGAKPGIVSVLHTWGQTLSFHPHIHVCISGGGITPSGKFKEAKHKSFFIPQPVLASMFRGKYMSSLKTLYSKGLLDLSHFPELQDPRGWHSFIDSLYGKKWLPFIKETFNGRGNAIRYLARYSFRTAIANSRIVSITNTDVTFKYKDYADGGKEKLLAVKGTDFIGMFLQHILPKGFSRIRFSGYLTNSRKSKNLALIHRLRNTIYSGNPYKKMSMPRLLLILYKKDICKCPECSGKMIHLPRGTPFSKMPSQLRECFFAMS